MSSNQKPEGERQCTPGATTRLAQPLNWLSLSTGSASQLAQPLNWPNLSNGSASQRVNAPELNSDGLVPGP